MPRHRSCLLDYCIQLLKLIFSSYSLKIAEHLISLGNNSLSLSFVIRLKPYHICQALQHFCFSFAWNKKKKEKELVVVIAFQDLLIKKHNIKHKKNMKNIYFLCIYFLCHLENCCSLSGTTVWIALCSIYWPSTKLLTLSVQMYFNVASTQIRFGTTFSLFRLNFWPTMYITSSNQLQTMQPSKSYCSTPVKVGQLNY